MADYGYPGSPASSPLSDDSGGHYSGAHDASIREQDRFLPIANVSRIMKKSLPANAKISKDAKETVQECVSEFISFITGEASDKCQREKRKTINGDDLLWAMSTLGFEDYVEPLKIYLQKYREMEGEKSTMAKQGDQSVLKEGNGGLVASGIPTAMQQLVQQPYLAAQPGMMLYGHHQMKLQYPSPAGSGGNSSNKTGGVYPRGP